MDNDFSINLNLKNDSNNNNSIENVSKILNNILDTNINENSVTTNTLVLTIVSHLILKSLN